MWDFVIFFSETAWWYWTIFYRNLCKSLLQSFLIRPYRRMWLPNTFCLLEYFLFRSRFFMFWFYCYWWEVTPWNVHIAYKRSPYLFKIVTCIMKPMGRWLCLRTDTPEGIHHPNSQTFLTWNLSNNVLRKLASLFKF